jgi:hypothetical protein
MVQSYKTLNIKYLQKEEVGGDFLEHQSPPI